MGGESDRRQAWLIYRLTIGRHPVGPALRVLRLAESCRNAGFRVHLAVESSEVNLPEGVDLAPLDASLVESIQLGDPVILSAYAPFKLLRSLLDRRIPFHADLFNLTGIELLEERDDLSPARLASERFRRSLRYLAMIRGAERFYVSTLEQVSFLAGLGFGPSSMASAELLSDLPARSLLLPMGCSLPSSFPKEVENPYPSSLKNKSIFLWGGGLWKWFDLDTLLEAFRLLKERGDEHNHLFFLSGVDHRGDGRYGAVLAAARENARAQGVLDVNVHFNPRAATFTELPGYLSHCRSGIATNVDSLESFQSWRTRLLDLLWASRPAVLTGSDPLGERMAEHGAAICCPAGDAQSLANAIERIGTSDAEHAAMCKSSASLGEQLCWENTLAPFEAILASSDSFRKPSLPLPASWNARYQADLFFLRAKEALGL